jgi:hypothetical protein
MFKGRHAGVTSGEPRLDGKPAPCHNDMGT